MQRSVASLLLAVTLAGPSCYYQGQSTVVKRTSFALENAEPVHVGSRLDVVMRGDRFVVTSTPMCAAAMTGTYTVVKEERQHRRLARGQYLASLIVGVGAMVGGYFAWDSPVKALSYEAFIFGAGFGLYGLIGVAMPKTMDTELPPATYNAAAFAGADAWTTCGEPTDTTATLRIEVSGGSDSYSVETSDAALGSNLKAWAAWCEVPLRFAVSIADAQTTGPAAILEARSLKTQIEVRSTTEVLETEPALKAMHPHLELGEDANKLDPYTYPAQSEWAFELPIPRTKVLPNDADTPAAKLARACYVRAKEKADRDTLDARNRCFAPFRAQALDACRPTCVDRKAQLTCSLKRESCTELTGGIGGDTAEDCAREERTCLSEANQSASDVRSCMDRCEAAAFDKQCPAP